LRCDNGFNPTNIIPLLRRAPPVKATIWSTAGSANDFDEIGELLLHCLEGDALIALDAPDQAAGVLADAIVHRPRRLSSPFGEFASVADAVNPMVMDYVRNHAFTMFDDSAAARGGESTDGTAKFDRRRKNFVRATRGIHW